MTDNLIHMSNISKGAAIALVVVVASLWDHIEKIKNKFVLYSIMGYATVMFIADVACIHAWDGLANGNPDKFRNLMLFCQSCYVFAFTLLVFHSSYRAALILLPRSPHILKFGLLGAASQLAIHLPATTVWGKNMYQTYGTAIVPASQKLELVVLVYYSLIESTLFLLTQYRIIKVKSSTSKNTDSKVKITLYVKGVVRACAYSVNVALIYISLGNRMPQPQTMNWNFPLYCPVFILMVILTDATRFQECIEKLSPSTGVTHTSGGSRNTQLATETKTAANRNSMANLGRPARTEEVHVEGGDGAV